MIVTNANVIYYSALFCVQPFEKLLYLCIVRVNYMTLRYFCSLCIIICQHINRLTLTIQNIMMCQLSITYQQFFSMLCIFWENQINHFFFELTIHNGSYPKKPHEKYVAKWFNKRNFLIRWKLYFHVLQTRLNSIS